MWRSKITKGRPKKFLEYAKPCKSGKSRWISIKELESLGISFGNGNSLTRRGSSISKYFYVIEQRENPNVSHSKVTAIKLDGYRKEALSEDNYIRADIVKEIKSQRCPILGTSNPEVDHKNGRKNGTEMELSTQKLSDFQPLDRRLNIAKREVCKKCKETGRRYDARLNGYSKGWTEGSLYYNENIGCKGCFWYDIREFNRKISSQ